MSSIVAAKNPNASSDLVDIPAECVCCDSPITMHVNPTTYEMESYDHPDNSCMGRLMIHAPSKADVKAWLDGRTN